VPPRAAADLISCVRTDLQNTNSPQLEDVQFTSMLGAYSMRNLTTYVGNEQQVWTPGPGGSADAMLSFTMTVQLRIVSRSIAGGHNLLHRTRLCLAMLLPTAVASETESKRVVMVVVGLRSCFCFVVCVCVRARYCARSLRSSFATSLDSGR
jgi:hypothetical protein